MWLVGSNKITENKSSDMGGKLHQGSWIYYQIKKKTN